VIAVVEKSVLIVQSSSLDVFFNLALEEHLLDHIATFGRVLLLYRNRDAVVMGKNQNPWRECDVPSIVRDGVALARRSSGGGTVYHDEGNLNFSLIMPRTAYDLCAQFDWVAGALKPLGIDIERSGNNGLSCKGLKVSGNAFCLRRDGALHHGTLLVKSDLARLQRYLVPALASVKTHAIASVPAKVGNLAELVPGVTMEAVERALAAAFGAKERRTEKDFDWADFAEHLTRHRDWDWVYGHTPRFEVETAAGRVVVDHGRVVEADDESRIGDRFDYGN
jgi:lipoate-protein ligase A